MKNKFQISKKDLPSTTFSEDPDRKEKRINLDILKSGAGFTLIELLIVIAIIGILTALVVANYISARQRARDAERKSDLRQIQAALEMYRQDQGYYPSVSSVPYALLPNCPTGSPTFFGNAPSCTTTYLSKIPIDPLGTSWANDPSNFYNGNYSYSATSNGYSIVACLENTNDPQGSWGAPYGCTSNYYYELDSP